MKKSIFVIALAALTATACNSQSGNQENEVKSKTMKTEEDTQNNEMAQASTPLIGSYLELKDALVADNGDKAADAGKKLFENLKQFDVKANANGQEKELTDIVNDAKENAEHISENAGDIDHQREHLSLLSSDMKDLLAIVGSDRNLYEEYCPMYDNHEGASWLSATKEIKNPYYGSKMLKCGKVQSEIQAR